MVEVEGRTGIDGVNAAGIIVLVPRATRVLPDGMGDPFLHSSNQSITIPDSITFGSRE